MRPSSTFNFCDATLLIWIKNDSSKRCILFLLTSTPLEKLLKLFFIQFLLLYVVAKYFENIINQMNRVTRKSI